MMDFRAVPLEIKAISETGEISGYASLFGEVDSYSDIVDVGAFALTASEFLARGSKGIPILLEHNPEKKVGAWKVIQEDEKGLYVEGKLLIDAIPDALAAHALLKEGAFDGLSIGYHAKRWAWDEEAEVRHLQEISLKEVSLVFNPALATARIEQVKSANLPGLTSDEIAGMDEKSLRAELESRLTRNAGLPRSVTRRLIKGGLSNLITRNAGTADEAIEAMTSLLTELKKGN